MTPIKALIVDDEPLFRRLWQQQLGRDPALSVQTCQSGEQATHRLAAEPFDVAVVDVNMPGMNGLALLKHIKQRHPLLEVIMLTGAADFEGAVEAGRLGAFTYLNKADSDHDSCLRAVRQAARMTRLARENSRLRQSESGPFFSHSASMRPVQQMLDRFAPTEHSILLLGPNGVGKSMLAREIHARSPRANGPFLTFDAGQHAAGLWESRISGHVRGAYSGAVDSRPGIFEAAKGGTVFLDEIGDIPLLQQSALLRVLQDRTVQRLGTHTEVPVDVRIISATNRNIQAMIASGAFREDLYHRLKFEEVLVPALKARREDIPMLVRRFLDQTDSPGISADALAILVRYEWPGNVRELERVVKRAAVLAGTGSIDVDHLPEAVRGASGHLGVQAGFVDCDRPWRLAIEPAERAIRAHYLRTLLDRYDGNMTRAARAAELDRANFRRHVRRYLPDWTR